MDKIFECNIKYIITSKNIIIKRLFNYLVYHIEITIIRKIIMLVLLASDI